ncbi:MAG: type VI secretion system contractile sheath small subunit [Planctomycetaceae bacterium]|nr:type VI secretion system contractile sheath small subunit [Planctomycetaceae bacterium]
MAAESVHQKLKRVRKPRVHITYEVETEGAEVLRELPFVVGVMGDFSGNPTKPLPDLEDRKFITIDRDNFNDVMKRMTPGVNIRVDNTMGDDDAQLSLDFAFNSLDDFDPVRIAEQVPQLKKLLETRDRLRDLQSKADRSRDLSKILGDVLQNTEDLNKLAEQLGTDVKD